MLSRSFVQSHAALNLSGKVESESGGLGGTTNENETRCSQIQVGDIIFKNPVIHLVQDNQGIWVYGLPWLIGNEALRRFDFTIDFADKKLFFKKNSNFDDPYDHTSTGLGVLATGPDLKILKVVDVSLGSPAAKAGFQTGDILLKIDDIDISQMKRDEARSLFIKEGLHHVVVERNGQPVMLEFQMDDPLKN
jgi:membrane-associated protease RseP (regulator of RpoE activity)